ncbi:protein of unknown function [Xenorhabdus doucetiae]|uniref:Uncharacterized protein n=1 Tax=Xenorhabdus doucetiae TaxID=351671 RepID=A0A068QN69_9GAMM|nr:protein of unknown function [Xenorhabdus doucetiae]
MNCITILTIKSEIRSAIAYESLDSLAKLPAHKCSTCKTKVKHSP